VLRIFVNKNRWIIFAMLFSVAAVLAHHYHYQEGIPNLDRRIEFHNHILNNTASSPFRYRLLVPAATNILIQILGGFTNYRNAFLIGYLIFEFCAIFALLSLIFIFLEKWFPSEYALIGTLFVAGTMSIALRDHYFQPWSFLEPCLFTLGLLLIYRKMYFSLCVVIALGAFNRATAVFIPLAFLFTNIDLVGMVRGKAKLDKKIIFLCIIYFAVWGIIFGGLRYSLGSTAPAHTVRELWIFNTKLGALVKAGINNILFLGFFWIFAILGFRYAPVFIRRVTFILPFYLFVILIYGVWFEVRLLMPLYPILVSLGLSYFYHRIIKK